MTTICLQAGHEHIQTNCRPDMRGSTGASGEISWTPMVRSKVAELLRANHFSVVEVDANLNCASVHPRFDLTLAIHYQSDTGHSGFGVFVPDASLDRDTAISIKRAKAIATVYAARTQLPNYSSPRLGLNKATWENPNTLRYYAWATQNGPLALIECGEGAVGAPDHQLLYGHTDRVASAIAEGICVAFGVKFVDPAVVAAQAAAAKAAADAKGAADAAAAADASQKAAAEAAAAAAAKQAADASHAAAAAAAAAEPVPVPRSVQDVLVTLISWLIAWMRGS